MNIYDYYNKEIPLEKPQNKLYISPAKSFHTQQSPFLTTPKIKTNNYILQNISPKTLFSQNIINNNPIIKDINPNHISAIINHTSKKKLQRVTSYRKSQKKTLILDIDETLVHSAFTPLNRPADISLNIELNGLNRTIYVLKRPHVDEFLEELSNIFEIITFTASLPQYAGPLLDKLDKFHIVNHRLFRESCIHQKGIFIKDLRKVGRDLKNVIIIDNNPISYIVNMDNGIPISTWYENLNDDELMKLIPLLKYLSNVEDVRPIIRQVVNRKINQVDFNIVNQLINGNNDNIVNPMNGYIYNRIINYTMISKNITNSLSNMSYNDYLKNLDNVNINEYNPQNCSVNLYNKFDKTAKNPINKDNNDSTKKKNNKNTKKNYQIKLDINNIINSIKLNNNKKSHKNMIKNNTLNKNNNKLIKKKVLVNKKNVNANSTKKININTINNNKIINNSRNIINSTKKILSLNNDLNNSINNKKEIKSKIFDSPQKFPEDNIVNQKKKQNTGSPQDSNSKNKKKSLNFMKIIKLKKNTRNKNKSKTFNNALQKYDKIINNSLPANIATNNVNFNNEMLLNKDNLEIKNQTPKKNEKINTVSIIRKGLETDETRRTKKFISKKFDKYNEINRNNNKINNLNRNKTENVTLITNYEDKNKSENKKENKKSNIISYIKVFKSNTHLKIKNNSIDNEANSSKKKEKKKIKNINVNIKKINKKKLKKDMNKIISQSKEQNIDNNKYNENIVYNDVINSQIIYPEKKYTSENVFKFTDNYANPFINEQQIDENYKNYYFNKPNNGIVTTSLGQYMKFERNKDLYNNSLDIFYPENTYNYINRNNIITMKSNYNNSDYISSLEPYTYLINNNNNENSYLYNNL